MQNRIVSLSYSEEVVRLSKLEYFHFLEIANLINFVDPLLTQKSLSPSVSNWLRITFRDRKPDHVIPLLSQIF